MKLNKLTDFFYDNFPFILGVVICFCSADILCYLLPSPHSIFANILVGIFVGKFLHDMKKGQ